MEAIKVIVQFGVSFDLLDQTILQAITFFESYLAKNNGVVPWFMKEIAIIAVEISIKNNEDKVLSLRECVYMIDKIGVSRTNPSGSRHNGTNDMNGKEKFNVKMFGALEQHILQLLEFKINIPTAFDFMLFFAHRAFLKEDAQILVRKSLPWIYFVAINYELSRDRKPSAIALAALCHTIQNSDEYHAVEIRNRVLESFLHKKELIN